MDVILLERIERLGQMGDVVRVKPGFARNFLLPRKKALRATKENKTLFETQRATLEARNLERRQEAQALAERVTDLSVVVIRQASETGQLYGSIRPRDIAEAVGEKGLKIERTQVKLDQPIKTIGITKVKVALHPEVSIEVAVNVARSPEEAELQAQGKSVLAPADEVPGTPAEEAPAPATEGAAEA
ncbi:MAG TPA: 50S ribosomal protein L9 [Alphaproteobacteria bacterium]|nr:50S ribosomal protein L9 [Alphaproteobacteria bacterium]